jgi:hypothetical protein
MLDVIHTGSPFVEIFNTHVIATSIALAVAAQKRGHGFLKTYIANTMPSNKLLLLMNINIYMRTTIHQNAPPSRHLCCGFAALETIAKH